MLIVTLDRVASSHQSHLAQESQGLEYQKIFAELARVSKEVGSRQRAQVQLIAYCCLDMSIRS